MGHLEIRTHLLEGDEIQSRPQSLDVVIEVKFISVSSCSWPACGGFSEETLCLVLTPSLSRHPYNPPGDLATLSRTGFLQVGESIALLEAGGLPCCPGHQWRPWAVPRVGPDMGWPFSCLVAQTHLGRSSLSEERHTIL